MTSFDLSRAEVMRFARESGLAVTGITHADPFPETESFLVDHVRRGHMRGMDWFTEDRVRQSCEPRTLHEGVRSIVSVAIPFYSGEPQRPDDGVLRGRIARYAWGRDYHNVLRKRMLRLTELLTEAAGRPVEARTLSDTARVVDRAVAARAGTGWYGKNTMIIIPGHGSWAMLGELMLDLRLPADVPIDKHCGRCAICIDQCPTGAIVEPYRIDAPRCISYLTIEERGPIPHGLRPLMGDRVFGCDTCQDVCPYTRAAQPVSDPDFAPASLDNAFPSLARLARMSNKEFLQVYSGTPVTRAKRRGMARNAAVALGNSGHELAEPVLAWMLAEHDEPLARGHAAVALRQLSGDDAVPKLDRARRSEPVEYVRSEIEWALERNDRIEIGAAVALAG